MAVAAPLCSPSHGPLDELAAGLAGVWRADALADGPVRTVPSRHAPLDAELPGGGWPLGALVELLQGTPEVPVWPLVLPALAARQRGVGGMLAVVNPPHEPFVPALVAAGVRADAVLWLAADAPAASLWLVGQALACADVTAVLAWLPHARVADLRRLQLAAAQRGDGLLFALRPMEAAASASPAPLRVLVESGVGEPAPALRLRLLKRRGPSLGRHLLLAGQRPALREVLASGAGSAGGPIALPADQALSPVACAGSGGGRAEVGDVVVRLAVAA